MTLLEDNPELVFLCGFLLLYVLIQWFDAKTDTDILGQKMDDCISSDDVVEASGTNDEQTIAELKERVAVLEKIVTDSRYELDEKLNKL